MPTPGEPMWRRYLRLFGPNVRADIDDELNFHFDERIEELRAQGHDTGAARHIAQEEFGDVATVRSALQRIDGQATRRRTRRANVAMTLGGLWLDLRFAYSSLRASPGLVISATATLALAIAINVTAFSLGDVIVWRPFSVPAGDRLVRAPSTYATRGWDRTPSSLDDFLEWRDQAKTVELAAGRYAGFNWSFGGATERLAAAAVSARYLAIHGVPPLRGREFTRDDESPGSHVAMIGEWLWRERYGGDSAIVGRSAVLDGLPYTIIGVVAGRYSLPMVDAEVWVPLTRTVNERRGGRSLWVMGQLTQGKSLEEARAELTAIARQQEQAHPATNKGYGVTVERAIDAVVTPTARRAGTAILVAVWLVLLIACTNIANLLLARTAARAREIAIRTAIGAPRARIARLLLVESGLLALIGGLTGIALSTAGLAWLRTTIGPNGLGEPAPFYLSTRVVAAGLGYAIVAGLLFVLLPIVRSHVGDLVGTIRDGGRSMSVGPRTGRLRTALVAGELALAIVLLVTAGMTVKAGYHLATLPLGFEARDGLTFRTHLSEAEYPDSVSLIGFSERLTARLATIPGVTAVGYGSAMPLDGSGGIAYSIDADSSSRGDDLPYAQLHLVSAGYFGALDIQLTRGRRFAPNDRLGQPLVAVINETMAKQHWPSRDPIGHHLRIRGQNWEIVGVATSVREWGVHNDPPKAIYLSAAQVARPSVSFVVRSSRSSAELVAAIRSAVAIESHRQPISRIESLVAHAARGTREARLLGQLFGFLGTVALILAVVGVYGVTAYGAAQRTVEIGIRRALGAGGREIAEVVGRTGGHGLILGGVVGTGAAILAGFALARALSLYQLAPFDLTILVGAVVLLGVASALAMAIPARRALRVDPMTTLRRD